MLTCVEVSPNIYVVKKSTVPQLISNDILKNNIKELYAGHSNTFFRLCNTNKIYCCGNTRTTAERKPHKLKELKELDQYLLNHEYVERINCGYYHTVFITSMYFSLYYLLLRFFESDTH